MILQDTNRFDVHAFIDKYGGALASYAGGQTIFAQGDPADTIFYIVSGSVKCTVNSDDGREAIVAILTVGDFFGSRSLNGLTQMPSTNITIATSEIARFNRAMFERALDNNPAFCKFFLKFVIDWNHKLLANLAGQFFHSSEKRLALILLTLANIGPEQASGFIPMPMSQEMLASMVGTTRSRINQFMNKFRRLGYIDYKDRIEVRNSLSNLISHGQSEIQLGIESSTAVPKSRRAVSG